MSPLLQFLIWSPASPNRRRAAAPLTKARSSPAAPCTSPAPLASEHRGETICSHRSGVNRWRNFAKCCQNVVQILLNFCKIFTNCCIQKLYSLIFQLFPQTLQDFEKNCKMSGNFEEILDFNFL